MDWDFGAFPQLAGSGGSFNQLLEQLRYVHEEVCARNAVLEGRAARNGSKDPLQSKKEDPWLPVYFVAPEDGPSPRRPPWRHRTPRVFDIKAADIFTKHQEALNSRIDSLAEQQRHFSEQIEKFLTLHTRPASVKPKSALSSKVSIQCNGLLGRQSQGLQAPDRQSQALQDQGRSSQAVPSRGLQSQGTGNDISRGSSRAGAVAKFTSLISQDEKQVVKKRTNAKSRFAVQSGLTTDLYDDRAIEQTSTANGTGDRWHRMRRCMRHTLNSSIFATATCLITLSYTILIAVETNMIAEDPDMESVAITSLHYAYTGVFCSELFLRFLAEGWEIWYGVDAFWNRLDTVLVICGLTEIIMEKAQQRAKKAATASSVARGIRIGRIIRSVRLIRTFHQFHDFQKMTFALISCFKTLICSLALLIFVMFFFAVYLTQSTANLDAREEIDNLDLRYGDLMSTTYTLFLSVSNGISWDLCYMPLHHMSWWNAQWFMLYIIVTLFGLLNVVTSVFVESTIRSVQHYKDIIVQDKEEERRIAMGHVKEVFRQVDSDGSGQVSVDEMEHFLGEAGLRKYMDALGIATADTRLLFRLLDCDRSGYVDVEEFCEGCLRLKGSAKSIDIHALIYRIKNFCDKWSEFTDYVEDSFSTIRRKLPGGDDAPKSHRLASVHNGPSRSHA